MTRAVLALRLLAAGLAIVFGVARSNAEIDDWIGWAVRDD